MLEFLSFSGDLRSHALTIVVSFYMMDAHAITMIIAVVQVLRWEKDICAEKCTI